jgi:hypothetical protein
VAVGVGAALVRTIWSLVGKTILLSTSCFWLSLLRVLLLAVSRVEKLWLAPDGHLGVLLSK